MPHAISIPQLRKSLEHITNYSENLVKSGKKNTSEMAYVFSNEWHKVFGKKLDPEISKKYIEHVAAMKTPKKSKSRKMRGGAQDMTLTGAPMAYLTRPGVDLPYGQFLPYVTKGFDVGVPTQAILQDCGKQDGVLPYPNTGSNKISGGGLFSAIGDFVSAASDRPFVAQNPPSIQQNAMMSFKGITATPGSEAWQQTWNYRLPEGATIISGPSAMIRDLPTDIVRGL
jgi:hypothetical protein